MYKYIDYHVYVSLFIGKMNGTELAYVLLGNNITKAKFGGVYNVENLPLVYNERKYFIINTSADVNIMGHWVLFIYYVNKLLFVDSLGKTHSFYGGKIEQYFNLYVGEKLILFKNAIQTNSSLVCGAYAIYFAFYINKKLSLNKIVKRFNFNRKKLNDKKVEFFLYKISKTKLACHKQMCPGSMFHKTCRQICSCFKMYGV
jgi:hypothetical protein